jgi:hypothetical protein
MQHQRRCRRTDVIVPVAVEEGNSVLEAVAEADVDDVSVAEPLEVAVEDCREVGTHGSSEHEVAGGDRVLPIYPGGNMQEAGMPYLRQSCGQQ